MVQNTVIDDRLQPISDTEDYAPSWVDRFIDRVRRLPVRSWLLYGGLWLTQYVLLNMVGWLDGSLPVGVFDEVPGYWAWYTLYYLALMHYLDGVADRSFQSFQPALALSENDARRLRYALTTMPAREAWVASGSGVLLTLLALPFVPLTNPPFGAISPLSISIGVILTTLANGIIAVFIYHTYRQLRIVSQIHRHLTRVDLFQQQPLYAFSRLTARTGTGALLGLSLGLGPRVGAATETGLTIAAFVLLITLAGAAFVLPLYSIHRLLLVEKKRLLAETNKRLEDAFALLHRRLAASELQGMSELKNGLDGLVVERDTLAKIPTWPWQSATLVGFLSAMTLPLVVWFVQQLLARLIFR